MLTTIRPVEESEYYQRIRSLCSLPVYFHVSGNPNRPDFLYITNRTGIPLLYRWDDARKDSQLLTPGEDPVIGQGVLHNSKSLVAFAKDRAGNQDFEIHLLNYTTNEVEKVTREPVGRVFYIFWTPEDDWIIVGHDKQAVYAKKLKPDGTIQNVFVSDRQILTAAYDSRRNLLVASVGRGEDTKLAVIDVAKSKVVHWISEAEKSQDYIPAVNSGRGLLAYETDVAKTHNEIVVRSLEGFEEVTRVPVPGELPWGMMYPLHWLDDDTLFAVTTKDAQISPRTLDLLSRKWSDPLVPVSAVSATLTQDGPVWIATSLSEPDHIRGLRDGRAVTIIPSSYSGFTKVAVESHWYTSFDGRKVQGWLVGNSDATAPLVVYCHGGPTIMTANWWDLYIESLVLAGYNVFAPNFRGSTSFGAEFRDLNVGDIGGGDLKDVLYAARYASELLGSDKKPAVVGGSYGGFLTLLALTTQPDEWAGGVAMVPLTDLVESHQLADAHYRAWDVHFLGGTPEEKPNIYRERSPITHIASLKTSVLILCGENDPITHVQPIRKFAQEARRRGAKVELVVSKDEGHGPLTNVNVIRDIVLGLEHLKTLFRVSDRPSESRL